MESHMHIWREAPLSETLRFCKDTLDEFGYETISLLALTDHWRPDPFKSLHQNAKTLYLKDKLSPRVYAYAHPHMKGIGPEDRGEYYFNQAKFYRACGFDGIKLHYAAFVYRDQYPHIPLSDYRYEPFFRWLEEEQIHVVIHLTAPEVCFIKDILQIPQNQRKFYAADSLFDGLDFWTLNKDFTDMMDKFPNLNVTLAHFGFLSMHMDLAEEWLQKYPNMTLDFCPSLFMYYDFMNAPDAWKAFFLRHSDRLLYGTDIGSNNRDEKHEESAHLVHLVRGFLEGSESIHEFDDTFVPIPLPDDILKKFYKTNILRCLGGRAPFPADLERMAAELPIARAEGIPTPLAAENLRILSKAFREKL